jgi:alkanesulfonate monooxygenase SsuD/methylene tetrahydromethanopterin reductase-like flavin-dependent oxidoreductase (luciferase family)
MARGIDAPVPTLQEAQAHAYSAAERGYIAQQRARLVHGEPGEVRDKLLSLKEQYAADELMIITITGDYESRKQSYRLLAGALGLSA